jgi:hypothetical protein
MEHVRTLSRDFETGESAVLHVESRSGAVAVEGADVTSVHVEATLRLWSEDPADADDAAAAIAHRMEHDGQRVVVRAPALPEGSGGWASIFGVRRSRVDYRIRVPRQSAVRVLSRSGRIDITGVQLVHAEAASGKCAVAGVRGDVAAVARSGSVDIEEVDGDVTVEARSGRLRVRRVKGDVQAESRSGAVAVVEVTGDARIDSRSGAVHAEQVAGRLHVRSRSGAVRYRGVVNADVDIEVQAGSILLEVDPDRPFFIDAASRAGSVRSDLPPRRGGGAPTAGGPKVRLRTQAGSIRLNRH